jgi:hypothetical protein
MKAILPNPKGNSILQRILKGLKIGWNTTTLPVKVKTFHNNPLIRIFRIIGGFCIFVVVSRHNSKLLPIFSYLPTYIAALVVLIALLHLIYIFVISFIRLKYIHHLFKSNKLEVRNSPMDRLATFSLKLLMCAQYGCVGVAGAGTVITAFSGLDSILELGGHDPIFTQGVADIWE